MPHSVCYWIDALHDPDDAAIRRAAAGALAARGAEAAPAVPALTRAACSDPDWQVQVAALGALAALGATAAAAVGALVRLYTVLCEASRQRHLAKLRLCWSPAGQQRSLAEARAAGQGVTLDALSRQDDEGWAVHDAVDACIASLGAAAVPGLVAALAETQVAVRAFAVRALRLVGPAARAAWPMARQALADPHEVVRWEAVHLLQHLQAGQDTGPRETAPTRDPLLQPNPTPPRTTAGLDPTDRRGPPRPDGSL
jgi:HEAT repeat protein